MEEITLHNQWYIKAPLTEVFNIMTDFEKFPIHFPKVAESIKIKKRSGNCLEIEAIVKSFGKKFPVKMKTQILPGKGFISDNDSYKFGTSGHEEVQLSKSSEGTLIDYTYRVSIHKTWLRIVATPLIRWYSMKYWGKAVIDELKKYLRNKYFLIYLEIAFELAYYFPTSSPTIYGCKKPAEVILQSASFFCYEEIKRTAHSKKKTLSSDGPPLYHL